MCIHWHTPTTKLFLSGGIAIDRSFWTCAARQRPQRPAVSAASSSARLVQSSAAPPTGGMWPRNRTPSFSNTPFKRSTEERKPGPGGVSSSGSVFRRGLGLFLFYQKYLCVWIPALPPRVERRYLDGVFTQRNFIQAFVSGMLTS